MWDCNFPGTVAAGIRSRAGGTGHVPKCSSVTITRLSALMASGLALHNRTWFWTKYFRAWFCDRYTVSLPTPTPSLPPPREYSPKKGVCSWRTTRFFFLLIIQQVLMMKVLKRALLFPLHLIQPCKTMKTSMLPLYPSSSFHSQNSVLCNKILGYWQTEAYVDSYDPNTAKAKECRNI